MSRLRTAIMMLVGTAAGIGFAWWATERVTRQPGGGCCSGCGSAEE